jgi:dephospho-CoA kinase
MAEVKLVLGLGGMPGSGKSLVVKVAKGKGYAAVVMGDIVRQEAERQGLKPTPENIGRIMLELREKEGKATIAERCISKINSTKENRVIVDGIRSLNEVEEFKKHFAKFSLVAICSSPQARFHRLYRRGRSDDADSWESFHERDTRELGVGLGDVIAMAEYTIINDDVSEVVNRRIHNVLTRAEKKWRK